MGALDCEAKTVHPFRFRGALMDGFTESKLIERRVDEFKGELPTVEEIQAFYSLDKISLPAERPYTWSNTLVSLDGVVSVGQGNMGVKIVGLKTYPKAKARTDFRLLAAGAFSPTIRRSLGSDASH